MKIFIIFRLTENTYQTAKVAKVLLLLNAGKGDEFKGKCLADIDIEDSNEIFGEYNQSDEEDSESHQKPKEGIISKDNYTQSHVISGKDNSNSKKQKRRQWSDVDKQLVLSFFEKHIQEKKAPKKEECFNFIKKNNSFSEKDWVKIKTLVYNTYRLK